MADVKIDGQTYTDVDMLNLEDTDGNEVKYYNDENLQIDYSKQITGKPKINGVELNGDLTSKELGLNSGGNAIPKLLYDKTFENPNSISDTIEGLSDCNHVYFELVFINSDGKSRNLYNFYIGGELYIYSTNLNFSSTTYTSVSAAGEIFKIGEKRDGVMGWYSIGVATTRPSGLDRITYVRGNNRIGKKIKNNTDVISLKMYQTQVVDSITIRIWGC